MGNKPKPRKPAGWGVIIRDLQRAFNPTDKKVKRALDKAGVGMEPPGKTR